MSIEGGAPKAGGSGGKVLIILGIVAGVGLLVCCGGVAGFIYKSKPTQTKVPAEVAALSNSVLPMDIDREKWEPAEAMEMSVPWVMDLKVCVWKHKAGEGGMMLVRLQVKIQDGNASQEEVDQQMEQSLSQGGNQEGQLPNLNISKSDDVKLTVLGQECTFKEIHGKRSDSDVEFRELRGHVRDGEHVVVIRIQLETEHWNDEEIKTMLTSAK